jgi:hypothetical protein
MTLLLAKSSWTTKERLTSSQLTLLATEVLKAPDAVAGGTYAPAAPIIVNGSGALQLGSRLAYTSRSVTRILPILLGEYDNTRAAFTSGDYFTSTSTTTSTVTLPLVGLPNGATLNTVTAKFKGNPAHGGAPGTMPTLKVYRRAITAGTFTQLGSTTTDTYGSAGAFETTHDISVASIAHTIDRTANTYQLVFTFEGGANAVSGASLFAISATCSVTDQSEF